MRKNDTVWVKQEGKLNIWPIDIVFRDADYVYIREGLSADDWVVTTHLSTVVEGADLRLVDEVPEPAEPAAEGTP